MSEAISAKDIMEKLTPLIREEQPELILLFGSSASGKRRKRSDIDLGFLFAKPVDIVALTNRVTRLLRTDAVDVVDLRRASPLLKYSAAKGGQVLYEKREGLFNEFYSLALRMYADTKKLREAQKVAINQFLSRKEPS